LQFIQWSYSLLSKCFGKISCCELQIRNNYFETMDLMGKSTRIKMVATSFWRISVEVRASSLLKKRPGIFYTKNKTEASKTNFPFKGELTLSNKFNLKYILRFVKSTTILLNFPIYLFCCIFSTVFINPGEKPKLDWTNANFNVLLKME